MKGMNDGMLRVYIAEDCPGSARACELVLHFQALHPDIPLELVDVHAPGATVPPEVFGTPIYTWQNQIVFLGNPSETELLEFVRNQTP